MADSREGSWQDGSMTSRATCCLQMKPSVPKKSLGGAGRVVDPQGLSHFRVKTSWLCSGNQIQSLQNPNSAKGSVAEGVLFFSEKTFWEVKEHQTTFWKRVLGDMNPVFLLVKCFEQREIKVRLFLHARNEQTNTQNGIKTISLRMVWNHHDKMSSCWKSFFQFSFYFNSCRSLNSSKKAIVAYIDIKRNTSYK